jgi:hypothetical protein
VNQPLDRECEQEEQQQHEWGDSHRPYFVHALILFSPAWCGVTGTCAARRHPCVWLQRRSRFGGFSRFWSLNALVPLFGLGQQGKSPTVTAQRHLNLYAEVTQAGDKSQVAFYGTPGLVLFASFGDTPIRGAIPVGDLAYVVHRGVFWELNAAGVKTNRGTIGTTSGRVSMAYNGTQIGMVDGGTSTSTRWRRMPSRRSRPT